MFITPSQPPSPQDPFPEFRQQYPGDEWGFACGAVKGLRIWRPSIAEDGRIYLKALYHEFLWQPGENIAECATGSGPVRTYECLAGLDPHKQHANITSISGRERLPSECWREHDQTGIDPGHACGFYAYQQELDTNPYLKFNGLCVEGMILGYGRTVIGTKGFRCGKAKILALVLPGYLPQRGTYGYSPQDAELHARLREGLIQTYPAAAHFPHRKPMLDAIPIEDPHD